MLRRLFTLSLSLLALTVYAQKKVVIYDLETKVPIRQARVWVDHARTFTTPYTGVITLPEKFDTLVVSNPKYLTYTVTAKNVGDSIGLIPRTRTLGEVEILGEDLTKRFDKNLSEWRKQDKKELAMIHPKTSLADFDFVRLFDFKGRARRKRTRKVTEALIKMETQEQDPIKRAYEKAMKEKGEQEEEPNK